MLPFRWSSLSRALVVAGTLTLAGCLTFAPDGTPPMGNGDAGTNTMPEPTGAIEVIAARNSQTSADYTSIAAAFYEQPGVCTSSTDGVCTYQHCPSGLSVTFRSAGTLMFTGTARSYTLQQTTMGNYGVVDTSGEPFFGGETVTMTASGAYLPGFSLSALAPFQVGLVQPTFGAGGIQISTSAALPIAWSGSPGGEVIAVLTRASTAGAVTSGYCRFPGEAGTGSFPAQLIAAVAAQDGDGITFSVLSRNIATTKIGTYDVQLTLSYVPSNTASGAVTFTP